MSERVRWTCPSCNRVYSVPTTEELTVCPDCLASELPVTFDSANASDQPAAVRPRTASVFAAVVSISSVVLRRWSGQPSEAQGDTRGHRAGDSRQRNHWLLTWTPAVSAIPRLIPTVLIDPDKALAIKLLNENLDDPHWEEVKWWRPMDQTAETQQIIDGLQQWAANPKVPPKNWIVQKLATMTDSDVVWAYPLDKMLSRLKSAPQRIARLKYRTKNAFGAMTIHDKLFVFRNNSVESHPVPSILQIEAQYKDWRYTSFKILTLDYFIAPSVVVPLDLD